MGRYELLSIRATTITREKKAFVSSLAEGKELKLRNECGKWTYGSVSLTDKMKPEVADFLLDLIFPTSCLEHKM